MTAPGPPQVNPLLRVGATQLEFWWEPPLTGDPVTSYTLSCASPAITQTYGPSDYYAIVTGLTTGQSYQFELTATNGAGTSPPALFINSIPGFEPGPVDSLSFTYSYTPSYATVSWNPPLSDGSSPINYYVVRGTTYFPNQIPDYAIGLPASISTYTLAPILSTTSYQFTVEPVNNPGYGPAVYTSTTIFQPNQLPNLESWFDSARPEFFSLSGSTIQTWYDRSGYGRNAIQANGSNASSQTLTSNNYPSVYFPPGGAYASMSNPIPVSTFYNGLVVFAVYACEGTGQPYQTLFSRTNGSAPVPFDMYNDSRLIGNNTANTGITGYDIRGTANPTLFSMQVNSNSLYGEWSNASTIYDNYTPFQNTYGDGFVSTFYIATRGDLFTSYVGTINELIVYSMDSSLDFTSTNRQKVEGYLAWKWGLQQNLPSDHPYFSGPPAS